MTKKLLFLTALIITTLFGTNILLANSDSESTPSINSELHDSSVKPVFRYSTPEIEQEAIEFEEFLKKIDSQESARIKCDEDKWAYYCSLYAYYQMTISKDVKQAYDYFIKSYNLGYKEKGDQIAYIQMKHPEIFTEETQPSIDESIKYLEASVNAGSIDAIRLLGGIYYLPEYNRFDYKKAEYYLKLGIEKNVRTSRLMLANLYLYTMKDHSKTVESIQLLKEDLKLARHGFSALSLMNIYLYPYHYGNITEQDYIKGLAYAYITRDLRKEDPNNPAKKTEDKIIKIMEKEFPPEVIEQAQTLYQQIKAEMDPYAETNKSALTSSQ